MTKFDHGDQSGKKQLPLPKPYGEEFEDWLAKIRGCIKDDSWDSLEEMRKYRQEELAIEKRKFG